MPYIMQNAIPGTPDVDEFGEPYTHPTFDVTNGEFGQRWLKIPNASPSLHAMFRRMLGSSYTTDPDYEMRIACGAEWRTGSDRRSGRIIITINPNYTQQFSDWCKSRWLGLTTASWFAELLSAGNNEHSTGCIYAPDTARKSVNTKTPCQSASRI